MGPRSLAAGVLCAFAAVAIVAKTPKNVFLFRVPNGVRPDAVQIRYLLTGKFGGYAGWQSNEHENSVWISTDYRETAAAALKALVFTPSCEPERVVVEDLKNSSREYALQCRPASAITLRGRFARPIEWQTLRVQVQVDYVAPWANQFFGVANNDLNTVGVGQVQADASGQFQVTLPVMAKEAADGAFTFVLREATSGNVLGVLRAPQALSSQHGLKASAEYPAVVEFGLERNR